MDGTGEYNLKDFSQVQKANFAGKWMELENIILRILARFRRPTGTFLFLCRI
jgi:hypothetical protein